MNIKLGKAWLMTVKIMKLIVSYVSIFTDNDLTNITEDHFEVKLIARLLDQIYVIQPPMFPLRYDDAPPQEYEYS